MAGARSLLGLLLLLACPALALGQPPAFPGAEGFGASSVGGRGGRAIAVTTLADSGPGSLRAALTAEGPRTIVFRVAGTIALQSDIALSARHSFLTVAGQTAPGCGVQVTNGTLSLEDGFHDGIVRYMRFRLGTGSGRSVGLDSFAATGATHGQGIQRLILDHSNFQWGTDENLDLSYNTTDVTVQWSILAEGSMSGHENGGRHSMGLLVSRFGGTNGPPQRLSLHHNLFANNLGRNPRIGVNAPSKAQEQLVDFRNNVIYNWGGAQGPMELNHVLRDEVTPVSMDLGPILEINIVNNVFLQGPVGGSREWPGTIGNLQGPSKIYLAGNATDRCPQTCDGEHWRFAFISGQTLAFDTLADPGPYRAGSAFATASVSTLPTSQVREAVLASVGATVPRRDAVDERLVREVREGTGGLGIQSSLPDLCQGTAPADSDGDGMPDGWEQAQGLNPQDGSDGARVSGDGYTHLEHYINGLTGTVSSPPVVVPVPPPRNLRLLHLR